jgi:zinc protease
VPGRAFGEALDLLADVVLRPRMDAEALDTERAVALAQLEQLRDDMYRYPMRLATEAAFAGHPYARNALGTEESLRDLSPSHLREWHEARVLHGDMLVAVVGDVDAAAVADQLTEAFADVRRTPSTPLPRPAWGGQGGVQQRVVERQKAQSALVMAFPGPARRDRARHVAHLLSIVVSGLGGRFFEELRSRQSLAYTVHAGLTARMAGGLYTAYIAMSPEKEAQARDGLLREFDKLKTAPVTREELERARTYALGTHAIAQQSAGHVLNEVVDAWACGDGLHELGEYEHHIRSVTADDILALATSCFDEGHRVEGIVRGVGGRR